MPAPPIPTETLPSVPHMLEPYINMLDAMFQKYFPVLQGIAAAGLAEFILVTGIIGFFAFMVKYCTAQLWYITKHDSQNVSFSINYIENGILKLRPVVEETSIEILLKQMVPRRAFIKAVSSIPKNRSVARLPMRFESNLMGTIQSYVSTDFGDNFFAAAAGRPIPVEHFVPMITYERYEDVPLQKVRIIFTHIDLLNNLPPYENSGLIFEKPHQQKRLITLAEIKEVYDELTPLRRLNYWIELPIAR